MPRFEVYRSSPASEKFVRSHVGDIDEVFAEVGMELSKSTREWAGRAKPGAVFGLFPFVIVCRGIDAPSDEYKCEECGNEELEYGDLNPVEGGNVEQKIGCENCGRQWMDIFYLSERRELCSRLRGIPPTKHINDFGV